MKRERKGILKNRWAIAVLLAESLVFIDAIRAVTQVPILAPKIRGIASFPANATTILVVTLLLWIIAVITAPVRIPRMGDTYS